MYSLKALTFVAAKCDFFCFLASVALFLTTPPKVGRSGSEQELFLEAELHKVALALVCTVRSPYTLPPIRRWWFVPEVFYSISCCLREEGDKEIRDMYILFLHSLVRLVNFGFFLNLT